MKVLVTLPDELIAKLDGACGRRGRSAEIVKRLEASFDPSAPAHSAPARHRDAPVPYREILARLVNEAPVEEAVDRPKRPAESVPFKSRLKGEWKAP